MPLMINKGKTIMQHIIIVMPKRLGDALMATPALALLKNTYPDAKIDAICLTGLSAAVLQNNPAIKHIFDSSDTNRIWHAASQADLIICLYPSQTYFDEELAEFADRAHLFPDKDLDQHKADQTLQFVADCIGLKTIPDTIKHYHMHPDTPDYRHRDQLLEKAQIDRQHHTILGIHLGCYGLAKRKLWQRYKQHHKFWGLNNFIQLANSLTKDYPQLRIVVTGSKGEKPIVNKFCKKVPHAVSVVDQTTPLQLAALIDGCHAYLSSDTGAAHVAYAMQTPTTVLFGQTSPVQFGPYPPSDLFKVLQAEQTCDIAFDDVLQSLKNQLANHNKL